MACVLCLCVNEKVKVADLPNNKALETLLTDVLPQVSIEYSYKHTICQECISKLWELKSFKDQCFDVENKIITFKNLMIEDQSTAGTICLDITEVFQFYEKDQPDHNLNVCRTCFKLSDIQENFSLYGDTTHAAFLNSLFPELDLILTANPAICKECAEIADNLYQFQQKSLLVQTTLKDLSSQDQLLSSEDLADISRNIVTYIDEESTTNHCSENDTNCPNKTSANSCEESGTDWCGDSAGPKDNFVYHITKDNLDTEEGTKNISNLTSNNSIYANQADVIDSFEECTNSKWCKCPLCNETRKWEKDFQESIENRQIKDGELYKCSLCKFKTKMKQYLLRHIKIIHRKDCSIMYECFYCKFTTKNEDSLNIHVKLKHDKVWEMFECSRCQFKTKWQSLLNMHSVIIHDDECDSYLCPFCKYKTDCKDKFKAHNKFKHNDGIKTFDCLLCEYKTRYKCHLKTHIKAKHDENACNFHRCVYCGYKTKWKSSLLVHVKLKHGNDRELYECMRCSFKTKKLSRLKIHRKVVHETSTILSCIEFKRKSNLDGKDKSGSFEAKKASTAEKEEAVANKRDFIEEDDISVHRCIYCKYVAKRRDTLKRHVTAKHDNKRSYLKCNECEYQTKRKDALKRHSDVKHPNYIY